MRFNREVFFSYVRRAPFGGRLTQQQVDGMTDMLDYVEENTQVLNDIREIAYNFATTYHETGARMIPVRETFANSTAQAVARLDKAWARGRLPQVRAPYWRDGWFGRGRNQATHERNYQKIERETGIAATRNPDLLLDSKTDCRVLFPGNSQGWWTGKRLPDYFNATTNDPVGARAVVNGTDKAKHIGENIYPAFLGAFKAAETKTELPADVSPEAAEPDGVEHWYNSTTIISAIGGVVSAGGASFIAAINNPFSLIFLVAALGFAAWIIRERMRHAYEKGV